MPKDEWGVKRACPNCSTRFYDLRHDPMTCPACNTTFTVDSLTAVKAKTFRAEKVKPEPVDVDDISALESEDETIEAEDELEAEILEDDDDDNVDLEDIADMTTEEEEP